MLNGFTPNVPYMLSRATGKNVLYLSILVIMLVLRKTITLLRNLGLGRYLPLDNNIYIHKIVGTLIFVFGTIHTICHFVNFSLNVQPDPVKYLQLNGAATDQYQPPSGCWIPTNLSDIEDNCSKDSFFLMNNFTCQVCDEDSQPWSIADWIFTMKPGLFGLCLGIANITGCILCIIMIIIFTCSLPQVRRSGHFELFAFTHYLYVVYYILLVLHAPQFWKWFTAIGIIWVLEKLYRIYKIWVGKGKTIIEEAAVLLSNVTNLVIKRPFAFDFNPGGWVYVNIPR